MPPIDIIKPANASRYTLDGDDIVENTIEVHQQLIGGAVKKHFKDGQFCALVLIGGYGRGEGGFCMHDGQPAPYNDYDYFVVLRNNDYQSPALLTGLKKLAHELEDKVGVEVDFFTLHIDQIKRLEFSLMFAEMQWGHRVVAGDPDILRSMPAMPLERLRLSEFTRLMLNRGALLLLNRITLQHEEEKKTGQQEIFIKYLFKAVLASGDAWLAANAKYHPSYPVKYERLLELAKSFDLGALPEYYNLALEARFHPDYSQYEDWDLSQRQIEVEAIWKLALQTLETRRLGVFPLSWENYSVSAVSKGQSVSGLKALLKNIVVNLRDFGLFSVLKSPLWSLRYPRERLISVLPLLLMDDASGFSHVSEILEISPDSDWLATAERFTALWHRYS